MATLEVKVGSDTERYELTERETVIGRYPFCDIVLNVQSVSRQHARIAHLTDGFFIEDLNSQNGTFVNGDRIDGHTRLSDGDRVQIYEIQLVYHDAAPDEIVSVLHREPVEMDVSGYKKNREAEIVASLDVTSDSETSESADVRLKAVLQLFKYLGGTVSVDDVLTRILDGLFELFPNATRGYIMLAEQDDGQLVLSQIRDRQDESNETPTLGPISQKIAEEVMREGKAVLSRDAAEEDPESVLSDAMPMRSMVCAPLMGPDKVPLGIIHIYTIDSDHPFVDADLDVLVSVATVAGQALAYAREHEERLIQMRRREVESKRHAKELERYLDELEQYAFAASHDLKTPLRSVAGCCQLLQKRYVDQLDDEANEFIGHAIRGAERMQDLLDALLAYASVRRSAQPMKTHSLHDIVSTATANLEDEINAVGANITTGKLPAVSADAHQLALMFRHLIDNAIKFCGDRPPAIHIGARQSSDRWIVSVRDNGIGIDAEYWDGIFMLFQRLHFHDDQPGIGAGLAICRRIVERHGGRIYVKSKPGEGSVFYFTLPAANETEATIANTDTDADLTIAGEWSGDAAGEVGTAAPDNGERENEDVE